MMHEIQMSRVNLEDQPFLERYARARLEKVLEGLEWIDETTHVMVARMPVGYLVRCDVFTVAGEVLRGEYAAQDMWKAIDEAMRVLAEKLDHRYGREEVMEPETPAEVVSLADFRSQGSHRTRRSGPWA